MGELSLDGSLQPIKGALPIAIQARKEGFKGFILPMQNAKEAAIVNNLEVYGAENIKQVIDFLNGENSLQRVEINTREEFFKHVETPEFDFADVKGQESVKRAQYYSNRSSRVWKNDACQALAWHTSSDDTTGSSGNN